jgi:wyosine [tRNA(Phe)-imidazoG37] synthetase (radical SAM superfamily)
MIAFGPVPSRRLGNSLGVNTIPPKACTYSCIYCQLGPARPVYPAPRVFFDVRTVYEAVLDKVERSKAAGIGIDYITFVGDGEPTLDGNLGRELELLKPLGIKTAVISNSTLINNDAVKDGLSKAAWISLKVDTLREKAWRRLNRPDKGLDLSDILNGIREFSRTYEGELITETMLVKGVNDGGEDMERVAEFLETVEPSCAYLSIPTRPPALKSVRRPDETGVIQAYRILSARLKHVELLTGYEGADFSSTGNIEKDLLGIMAVHPMRRDAVHELLLKSNSGWSLVQRLIDERQLVEVSFEGEKFIVKNLREATR